MIGARARPRCIGFRQGAWPGWAGARASLNDGGSRYAGALLGRLARFLSLLEVVERGRAIDMLLVNHVVIASA